MKLTKRHEWIFYGKDSGIVVSCNGEEGDYTWCVYAIVYESHPDFNNPKKLVENLPFHGGCTYDEKFTVYPARGIRSDWQKERSYLKIGCDYHHYGDDYYMNLNPDDGIPQSIKDDAKKIHNALQ